MRAACTASAVLPTPGMPSITLTPGAPAGSPVSSPSSSLRPTNSVVSGGRVSGRGSPGIPAQDPLVQFGQRRPRLGALFLDKAAARLPVEAEPVTWPATPVQGSHLVGDERLVQRVGNQQVVQFADQVGVPAERELTLDPFQNGRPPLLFEAVPHPGHPAAVDAREGLAAPEPVRLTQQRGRLVMV